MQNKVKAATNATTGPPQGPPVSPAIYITEIHRAVEDQVEACRGISFVKDVTWVVGGDIIDIVRRLECCAAASLRWASNNAVRFETSKTKAVFSHASTGTGSR